MLPKNSQKYPRNAAVKKKMKTYFDFFNLFFSTAAGGASCFFLVAQGQHALIKNQLVRRMTLDPNIGSAHGQPARCPARPTSIDDGLEDIRWIHDLGVDSFAGGVLRYPPTREKKKNFRHSRRMENFCLLFCPHQRAFLFFSSFAWPAPAT